jgi:hypothetical protein
MAEKRPDAPACQPSDEAARQERFTRGRRLEVDEAAPPNEGGGSMSDAIKTSKRSSGEAESEYQRNHVPLR